MTQTPPISAEQVEAALAAWRACTDDDVHVSMRAALTAAASIPASRGVETNDNPEWGIISDDFVEAACLALENRFGGIEIEYDGLKTTVTTMLLRFQKRLAASPAPQPVQEQEPGTKVDDLVEMTEAANSYAHQAARRAIRANDAEAKVERLTEALRKAHQLAADARDRRSSMVEMPPADIIDLVEATRPLPQTSEPSGGQKP